MDKKPKKVQAKKSLVRNTERPVPKTKFVVESKRESTKTAPSSSKTSDGPHFDIPELNSTLGLSKKIEQVEKAKFPKCTELAFDEMVTRKVNFPYDQPIYKDLIPLQGPTRPPLHLVSREPLPHKDKEPNLWDFIKVKEEKEFIYRPTINIEKSGPLPGLNNLRLYKILQSYNE